jgi:hypothetical protein
VLDEPPVVLVGTYGSELYEVDMLHGTRSSCSSPMVPGELPSPPITY